MNKIIHSNWYYKYYNQIFSRGAEYKNEIELIGKHCSLIKKDIQEIGGGLGGHADEVLKYKINSIDLIDYDKQAIDILKKKYKNDRRVTISFFDGFDPNIGNDKKFDMIYSMYSVLTQNCTSLDNLLSIIKVLYHRIKTDGHIFFETIDYDMSKKIYPNNYRNEIYNDQNNYVFVESTYELEFLKIIYSGKIENNIIEYTVPILRSTKYQLFKLIKTTIKSNVNIYNMDIYGRRILIDIHKNFNTKSSL